MTHGQAKKRSDELRRAIARHDRLYYQQARPEISDEEYDGLMQELAAIEARHPDLVTPDSPTQRVAGEPSPELRKVTREVPMLSLDATREEAAVREFDIRVRKALASDEVVYVAEPKFDGVSIEVVYERGSLLKGSTRGDGRVGEDVTANLRTIRSLPLRLEAKDPPPLLTVRGEVLMHLSDFQELNAGLAATGEELFANPRNASAGAVRQLDPKVTASRPLVFYAYEVVGAQALGIADEWSALERLKGLGFLVDPTIRRARGIEQALAYHADLGRRRDRLAFEIDGVVIKVDRLDAHAALGARTKSPRWALAFKFEPRAEVSVVERIVVQVGRTGKLTPVALLRPVSVGGVTVSRATLHNQDEVLRKDVREGDQVRVRRAGDVIPEVAEVLPAGRHAEARPFTMPPTCPACGAPVHKEGAYHVCPGGYDCPAQKLGLLEHFAARGALDIEGLGARTVRTLVDAGLVEEPADLYRLTRDQVQALERHGERSAENLIAAIDRARAPRLDRLLFGLGIPLVGSHVARVLADAFSSLERMMAAGEEELLAVREVGPEVARAVRSYFGDERNRGRVLRLLGSGVHPVHEAKPRAATPLLGKKVVFTGTLPTLSRERAKELVEQAGGRVVASVSRATDLVIAGSEAGSKLEKAKALGLEVRDEQGFLDLLEE